MKLSTAACYGAPALACTALAVTIAGPVYPRHQVDLSAQRFQDLQQRLAAHAMPIRAAHEHGQLVYSCIAMNGFIVTAPAKSELSGLCGG
ncbi:hypothetical protein [Ralstonia pseudosolanacearum]|uniref:hypothetical protein n=1 Tax=Ralstonia pseudosolanacearum TaxID=1310165 RepID=UPI001FF9DEB7|nr:hypothetical protein [Ralstonia pseudosolanacearum]